MVYTVKTYVEVYMYVQIYDLFAIFFLGIYPEQVRWLL